MTIYGMTGAEIKMLERWAQIVRLDEVMVTAEEPFRDLLHMRAEWAKAGGKLPITEEQVVFLKRAAS